ncbi:MAG: hypothetical protein SGBAC_004536 [Bacillariaceae sp.]
MSADDLSVSKMDETDMTSLPSISAPSSSATTTTAAPTSSVPQQPSDGETNSAVASANTAVTASFKIEDFECMLCLRLLYEPTTLKCGHSFCRTCVEELYQQNHAKCPTCRQVLPIVHHYSSLEKMSIAPSFTLCKFLEAAFPIQYTEERRKEIMEMYPSRRVALPNYTNMMDSTARGGGGQDSNSLNATTTSADTTATVTSTPLPVFYLDPMVPRQVMQLNIFEHRYLLMISRCLEGSRHFGMVGFMSRRMIAERRRRRMRAAESTSATASTTAPSNGSSTNNNVDPEDDDHDDEEAMSMVYGVEVEIVESTPQPTGTMHIQVKAKRRFKIVGDTWRQDGYTMANVQWISLPAAAECTNHPVESQSANTGASETQNDADGSSDIAFSEGEVLPANTALSESQEAQTLLLIDPSENDTSAQENTTRAIRLARCLGPLVEEWKALVVSEGWQRYHGQLAQTINTIGPMPDADTIQGAIDRALWITALINPLPGMGVAPEIRPDVLETAAAADGNYVPLLLVVTHGMRKSIEYLTPNAVVVWMQYQMQKLYFILLGRGTRRLGPPPPLPGTHQMVNALLRLLVVCLVLGFFWQRILTPKMTEGSTLSSPAADVVLSVAAATASPSMDTEAALEL